MERTDLEVLVASERVRVGAAAEQQPRGLDVAEEAGETKRLEAIVPERVREARVLVQELPEPHGSAEGGCLEDVQFRLAAEQLGNARVVSAVEGFEQLRHTN